MKKNLKNLIMNFKLATETFSIVSCSTRIPHRPTYSNYQYFEGKIADSFLAFTLFNFLVQKL